MTCGQCKHFGRSICDAEFMNEKKPCKKHDLYVRSDSKQCSDFEKKDDDVVVGKTVGDTHTIRITNDHKKTHIITIGGKLENE